VIEVEHRDNVLSALGQLWIGFSRLHGWGVDDR